MIEFQHDSPIRDESLEEMSNDQYDPAKSLFLDINLLKLIKVEDWNGNGSTLVKNLRPGKGGNIKWNSKVRMRMRVLIDDRQVNNFYPKNHPRMIPEDGEDQSAQQSDIPYDLLKSEDLSPLTAQ